MTPAAAARPHSRGVALRPISGVPWHSACSPHPHPTLDHLVVTNPIPTRVLLMDQMGMVHAQHNDTKKDAKEGV